MNRLTDYDKLAVTEYILDILGKQLQHGEFDSPASQWVQRCKDECDKLRGQYLTPEYRLRGGGEL